MGGESVPFFDSCEARALQIHEIGGLKEREVYRPCIRQGFKLSFSVLAMPECAHKRILCRKSHFARIRELDR